MFVAKIYENMIRRAVIREAENCIYALRTYNCHAHEHKEHANACVVQNTVRNFRLNVSLLEQKLAHLRC